MPLTCPSCPRTRRLGQYLCRTCWERLTPGTRHILSIRDDKAFARLRQLCGAIAAGTPLERIEISR